jgi:hypothetical protein
MLSVLSISHERVRSIDHSDTESIYITNAVHQFEIKLPQKYIAWNLEQLTTDKNWSPLLWERFRGAVELWDYSLENIKVHQSHGNNALHVPYAYTLSLSYFPIIYDYSKNPKDVDMFLLGYMNERRNSFVERIPDRSKIVLSGDYYDENYATLCRRTKVGLNLHYYGGKTILEIHRILPMIANNLLVITQTSDDKWLDDIFAPIVEYFDENNFLEVYNRILTMDENSYQKKAEQNLKYLQKEYNMLKFFLKSKSFILDAVFSGE